jgi:hypothetical protein
VGSGPATGTPIASGVGVVGPHQDVVFVLQGGQGALEVAAYVGDASPLPPNSSRLQVVNLAVGNPAFKVARMEGDVLIESLDLMEQASAVVPAGTYNLRFSNVDTGEMMMEKAGIQVTAGTVTLLFAIDDDPSDPWVKAIPVNLENVPSYAAVRWAHLNLWGPVVDIYLDGELATSSLVYKVVTDYQLIEPKVYTVSAYQAGADPATAQPLSTLTLELTGDNFPRTMYIYGPADQAKIGVAPDSFELLQAGKARIRFINAAIDSASVAVVNATDGSSVVPDLQFGTASVNSNVDAGVYSFNFVKEGGPVHLLQGIEIQAGKVYTIVLAGVYLEQPGLETIIIESTP